MTETSGKITLGVGLAVVALAAIIGFLPLNTQGTDCGSVFLPTSNTAAIVGQFILDYSGQCDGLRSNVRIGVVALGGLGILTTAVGWIIWVIAGVNKPAEVKP